jgi:hypothetical protein
LELETESTAVAPPLSLNDHSFWRVCAWPSIGKAKRTASRAVAYNNAERAGPDGEGVVFLMGFMVSGFWLFVSGAIMSEVSREWIGQARTDEALSLSGECLWPIPKRQTRTSAAAKEYAAREFKGFMVASSFNRQCRSMSSCGWCFENCYF